MDQVHHTTIHHRLRAAVNSRWWQSAWRCYTSTTAQGELKTSPSSRYLRLSPWNKTKKQKTHVVCCGPSIGMCPRHRHLLAAIHNRVVARLQLVFLPMMMGLRWRMPGPARAADAGSWINFFEFTLIAMTRPSAAWFLLSSIFTWAVRSLVCCWRCTQRHYWLAD